MLASKNGRKETVELLLNRGAVIDEKNNTGKTALMQLLLMVIKKVVGFY